MYRKKLLPMILTLVSVAGVCSAESSPASEKRMQELEAALKEIRAELERLKTEQAEPPSAPLDREQIERMVDEALDEGKSDLKSAPEWIDNVKIKGDLRYRHEWKDDESQADDRNRHRIRARVGVDGKVNEQVSIGFRLASGNTSKPTSTNQDLDAAFSSKNVWLDLAYFDCRPVASKNVKVLGGKMNNPYFRAGKSNLMFDSDVNPEGIAAKYQLEWDDKLEVFCVAGGYYVEEVDGDADTSLWALQAGLTHELSAGKETYVTVGGGFYDYGNTRGRATLGSGTDGNTYTAGAYDSDFDIVQAFCEAGWPVCGTPFKVFGDYLRNTVAHSCEDTGFLVGAGVGRCKEPGSWDVRYDYRELDADAVIGALTEVTFGGGGTDVKGHTLCFGYQLAKNLRVGGSYFIAERTRAATTDHDVVLVDLNFRF